MIVLKFGMYTPLYMTGITIANLVSFRLGITTVNMCKNNVFFLSIDSQCGAPALWTALHTTLYLDVKNKTEYSNSATG